MKLLYIILDGLGDKPIKALQNKTPLEAAIKPHFDELAAKAKLGLLYPVERGLAPESDVATIALFGNNPFKCYKGRGPIEAFGFGIKLKKGDVALRCNFAYAESNILRNVRASVTDKEAKVLAALISKKIKTIDSVKVIFKCTKGYRAVLVLRGKGLSPRISNTHPGYGIYKNFVSSALPARLGIPLQACRPLENTKEAVKTANVVNAFLEKANALLKKQNLAIITRGAGSNLPKLAKLQNWAALVDMPTETALAKLMGMHIIKKAKNFDRLVLQVGKALKRYSAVYLHIKDTDVFSHNGDWKGKKDIIEDFDKKFLAKFIRKNYLQNTIVCITGDHSTPCETKAHSANPVPVLIYVPGELGDCLRFGEAFAVKGTLGQLNGTRLFNVLMKLMLFESKAFISL
ncbi:MAG: hypothetical protein QW063_00540 [Candidatus Nanoarchaeia archaeon]